MLPAMWAAGTFPVNSNAILIYEIIYSYIHVNVDEYQVYNPFIHHGKIYEMYD